MATQNILFHNNGTSARGQSQLCKHRKAFAHIKTTEIPLDNAIYMDKPKVKGKVYEAEFSKETELIGYLLTYVPTYYKELAHMNIETDDSLNLKSASWRSRRADGIVLVQTPAGSNPRKS